jgi:hypothetical protein
MRHANSTSFAVGSEPWNKDVRGIHLSLRTEFKLGQPAHNHQPVGTVKIRQRKNRREHPRAWVKVAEPKVWRLRAVVEWERINGQLPPGFVVHHVDRNSLNDDPKNLQALTRAQHLAEHRQEIKRAA